MRRFFLFCVPLIVLISFGLRTAYPQQKGSGGDEGAAQPPAQANDSCAECHSRFTPGIVVDWQLSKHSANDVGCSACHGDAHNSMTDVANAGIVGPEICAKCHALQVEQFGNGKHALAWAR